MDAGMDVLSDIILLLLHKAGASGLSKTQIVKLVFFVDLEAAKRTGLPLTNCSYKTLHYGVVDLSIWDRVEALEDKITGLKIHRDKTSHDHPYYRAVLSPDSAIDPAVLSAEAGELVESVWAQYGACSAAELGELTKKLVPMDDEWELDVPVDVRDIAYEMSEEFKAMVRQSQEDFDSFHTGLKPIEELLALARDED
jgi:uncharacterized phage-associated protein